MIATYPERRHLLPEERLWKAVLWRVFDDTRYQGKERTLIVAKKNAIKWFKARAQDFIDVCYFSNYNPAFIYEQYRKLESAGKTRYLAHQTKYLQHRRKYFHSQTKYE